MADLQQVLRHLDRRADDPSCGYITVEDIRATVREVYLAAMECCATDDIELPSVTVEQAAGVTPRSAGAEGPEGSVFINTTDGQTWIEDETGQWVPVSTKVPATHFGTAGPGAPGVQVPPVTPHGAGDKYLDLTIPDGTPAIYVVDAGGNWEALPSIALNPGDQLYDNPNYDIWLGG